MCRNPVLGRRTAVARASAPMRLASDPGRGRLSWVSWVCLCLAIMVSGLLSLVRCSSQLCTQVRKQTPTDTHTRPIRTHSRSCTHPHIHTPAPTHTHAHTHDCAYIPQDHPSAPRGCREWSPSLHVSTLCNPSIRVILPLRPLSLRSRYNGQKSPFLEVFADAEDFFFFCALALAATLPQF